MIILNTSDGQQQELLRNMRGLINDFARDKKGFPKIQDFTERLGIENTSVFKYKKIIMDEDRKSLLEIFGTERIENVKSIIKVLDENIEFNKTIRDCLDENGKLDKGKYSTSERMQASDNMEKSLLSKAQIMYDAPEYLYNDDNDSVDNDSKQEYSDRQEKTEPEGIHTTN